MKIKYQVFATQFDREKECQRDFLIGEFTTYINARLFRDAYNVHYSASAYIVEVYVA